MTEHLMVDVQLLECKTHHMLSNNATATMDTMALKYVVLLICFILPYYLVKDMRHVGEEQKQGQGQQGQGQGSKRRSRSRDWGAGGGAEAGTGTGEQEEEQK